MFFFSGPQVGFSSILENWYDVGLTIDILMLNKGTSDFMSST